MLEKVSDSSPHSVKAVACVNRYLNECLCSIRHRYKLIRVETLYDSHSPTVPWAEDEIALRNIHRLSVECLAPSLQDTTGLEDFENLWQPLANAIRSIARLKVLEWNAGPVPINVLKALEEQHPTASLKIDRWTRFSQQQELDQLEKGLCKSKQLTNLRAVFEDNDPNVMDRFLIVFKAIVSNARNLCDVRLNLRGSHGTQLDLSSTIALPNHNDEAVSQRKERKAPKVRHLTMDGPQILMSEETLRNCAAFIELGSLESIKFSRGQLTAGYFGAAASMLPNLKHVSLNFRSIAEEVDSDGLGKGPVCAAARTYLTSCSQLYSLNLWSWRKVIKVEDIVRRHGPTLETLQLHESEDDYPFMPSSIESSRPCLELSELKQLRTCCPALQHLTFDMNVKGGDVELESDEVNLSLLRELAQFESRLKNVQIYIESGPIKGRYRPAPSTDGFDSEEGENESSDSGEGLSTDRAVATLDGRDSRRPKEERTRVSHDQVMKHHVQYMWRCIYNGKIYGPRRLDVKVGEWESKMLVAYDRRRFFRVFPHERNDRPGQSVVKMHRRFGYKEG